MNEYQLNSVMTDVSMDEQTFKSWTDLESYSSEKMKETGNTLFFFDHKVVWAKWDGKAFQFPQSESNYEIVNLQMMRLFNEDAEIFIRRVETNKWMCRLRTDGQGNDTKVMDAHQFLLGESQGAGEFSKLWESSGSAKEIPISVQQGKRAYIKTRNYIGFAGKILANFEDSRFISIKEAS